MKPNEEAAACDYIASLWGKNRRDFARRYWLFLKCGLAEPSFDLCFGAAYIARKLRYLHKQVVRIHDAAWT